MTVQEIMKKMVLYSKENIHDINHFIKVYGYAKMIGECEHLASKEQKILEIAAILHDIACPLCREKYGNTDGKRQEEEGIPLVYDFLKETGIEPETVDRVAYLVGHHHTLTDIDGLDYQILIEADYLVNVEENGYSEENIRNMLKNIFKTQIRQKRAGCFWRRFICRNLTKEYIYLIWECGREEEVMRKTLLLWAVSAIIIMLVLPWMAVNFVSAQAGLTVCFLLFFIVNPIYAVTVGVAAGRNIKSLWYQPAVTSVLFLIGIGVFFETIDSAFIMYAFSYLVLGMLAAVISGVVRKRAH